MVQTLGDADVERLHRGVMRTAELLFAAGARQVFTPFADLPVLHGPGDIQRIAVRPRNRDAIELMTVHIMGTARMGRSASVGATDAMGAVFDVRGLVVADASVLPSSIGVNPQETIIAMTLRNCERWLEARP
jgi:choline dehydrogenase-like flavoprotein